MFLKIKHFISQLSPKINNIAGFITLGTFIAPFLFFLWTYHKNLEEENLKLKNELATGQMTLWVKNSTKETRSFNYTDILEGKGSGTPISAGNIQAFKMKKGVYSWYCYDSRNGFNDIDTLKKGELVFKYHQQKALVIIDK